MPVRYYEAISRSDAASFQEWEYSQEFDDVKEAEEVAAVALETMPRQYMRKGPFQMWYDENGPLLAIVVEGIIDDYRELWGPIAYKEAL